MALILITASILAIIILLLAVFIYKSKGAMKEPDYKNFFVMGIIWLPFGIVMMFMSDSSLGTLFFILGIAYIAIGMLNKDKWGKPRKKLTPEQAKFKIMLISGLLALVLLGFVAFWLVSSNFIK